MTVVANRQALTRVTAPPTDQAIDWPVVGLLGLALLLLTVLVVAFVVQPWWRQAPLRRARSLLTGDQAELAEAERLLAVAVTAGLRRRDLADARFALAYARARLGSGDASRYQQALGTVTELVAAGRPDAATTYLELWLHAQLGNHDRVREIYEAHQALLGGMLQTNLIASIAYLQRATTQWRNHEIDGAVHNFERVRELDVLTEHVPQRLHSLHIVHGIQAVFDGRLEEARHRFNAARDQAGSAAEPAVEARIGLAACDWLAMGPATVDDELTQVLAHWPDRPAEPGPTEPVDGGSPLLASTSLLHLICLLHRWLAEKPAKSTSAGGRHAARGSATGSLTEADRADFARRVDRVRAADPELGDALLVDGLIRYYFAADDAQRQDAVTTLELSTGTSKPVLLPEVLTLIDLENELAEESQDALGRYLAMVQEYLGDLSVPPELRSELRRRLSSLGQRSALAALDVPEEHSSPSVDDIRHRGALLRGRVHRLVEPRLRRLPDTAAEERFHKLLEAVEEAAEAFEEQAQAVHQAEQVLIVNAGEFLLPEETG